jgi:hypothetical protein
LLLVVTAHKTETLKSVLRCQVKEGIFPQPARDGINSSSSERHFFTVGPYMKTHPRHVLQQSRYSMCVRDGVDDWHFVSHDDELTSQKFSGPEYERGRYVRVHLPVTDRVTALRDLDRMNVNYFSLFGSDDSLVQTLAFREGLFKGWK